MREEAENPSNHGRAAEPKCLRAVGGARCRLCGAHLERTRRPVSLFDRDILTARIERQLRQAVAPARRQEPGDVRGRDRQRADHAAASSAICSRPDARVAPLWFTAAVSLWLWFTVLFANFAEAVAEGRGKAQADTPAPDAHADHRAPAATGRREPRRVSATALRDGRSGRGRGRRADPRRRRGHRGHRLRRRVGDHRRVGAGHPRERRRSLGGHRRHQGALRPHRRPHHRRTRASPSSIA